MSQKCWDLAELSANNQQLQLCICLTTLYILTGVGKLSRILQTKHLDLALISCLVNFTLHALDSVVLPAANWLLELLDVCENLEKATGISITDADITTFRQNVAKLFVSHLKCNISNCFAASNDAVSAMSLFDSRKVPGVDSPGLPQYGDESIRTLLAHGKSDLQRHHLVSLLLEKLLSPLRSARSGKSTDRS